MIFHGAALIRLLITRSSAVLEKRQKPRSNLFFAISFICSLIHGRRVVFLRPLPQLPVPARLFLSFYFKLQRRQRRHLRVVLQKRRGSCAFRCWHVAGYSNKFRKPAPKFHFDSGFIFAFQAVSSAPRAAPLDSGFVISRQFIARFFNSCLRALCAADGVALRSEPALRTCCRIQRSLLHREPFSEFSSSFASEDALIVIFTLPLFLSFAETQDTVSIDIEGDFDLRQYTARCRVDASPVNRPQR